MATEKVKKPRKPRKPRQKKAAVSRKKKTVERSIVQTAQVLFKDKIQLYELPTLDQIKNSELSEISIDTSVTGTTSSDISSIGTPLYKFSGITSTNLSSDTPYLLDEAAAKRYHTKANDLSARDLRLFSDYDQQGDKDTYFNDHPYVVNDIDINSLDYSQLLTKNNLDQAEKYFVNRFLNSKSKLNTFNWETDNNQLTQEVSGLNELLELDKWDSQATYKFEWGNDKRTTNVVDLDINASYYYTVIGIVSVKSILPDQKSGTIYLEAKAKEEDDIDDNWIVVDSAVFKFDQDNKNSGTYVTLSGYMSPGYVTRLRLNLHPNAYSMNNWEYREKGSISNHYSNTFVGTAYIFDDVISGESITVPVNIKFTDSNYRLYKSNNIAKNVDLTNDFITCFEDSQVYSIPVLDVVNKIIEHLPEVEELNISTGTQTGRSQFLINGLRYSPTGKIYPLNTKMNLYSNCILYPSYSSGTITVQQSSLHNVSYNVSGLGESWQNGQVLYNLNTSDLSALPSLDWPTNTEIYGNHEISGTLKQVNSSSSISYRTNTTISRGGPLSIGGQISSYATYKPRRDNHLNTAKIDFSTVLRGYDLVGDLTCEITATPRTWGGGSGNESWGRIRYGFTTAAQLNDNNTSASSTIVNPIKLKTKNITRWITNKMCTGSRWNVHSGTLTTSFTQSSQYKQIWIQACADTGKGDSKPTNFSVTVNVSIRFKYTETGTLRATSTSTTTITSEFHYVTTKTRERIIANSKIYPILSSSKEIVTQTIPEVKSTFRVDDITATGKFGDTTLTVIPYPQNT